jgi:two-component SAPR family response regulator
MLLIGTPDIVTPELFLDIKTVEVQTKTRALRTIKDYNPRFPRKLKKKLKSFHGENYKTWLNSPVKWVSELSSDIYSYHSIEAEEELTKALLDELNHENNEKD